MKYLQLKHGYKTLVDDEDYDKLSKYSWRKTPRGYVERTSTVGGKCNHYRLHRVLMNCPKGLHVDHINGDTLDNRKSNLRLCTIQQNNFNRTKIKGTSSKYKGVYLYKRKNRKTKWRADITFNRNHIFLGTFNTEEEAYESYKIHALKFFGEFAKI